IPYGHNPADYVTTRIMATSHDGALVPVSILHRKDLARDGQAPLLLYGYGSYGMAMPASFAANRLSLVDRGFVYAIAHIRGGADKGWGWYLDGKREKKTNSFDDFAAAGRALCGAKYTNAKRSVGHGGRAGGMLMGAAASRAGSTGSTKSRSSMRSRCGRGEWRTGARCELGFVAGWSQRARSGLRVHCSPGSSL